jgi:hypothetical protein
MARGDGGQALLERVEGRLTAGGDFEVVDDGKKGTPVGVPVLVHLRSVWRQVSLEGPPGFQPPEEESPILYSEAGAPLGELDDLVRKCVARELAGRGPGEYRNVPVSSKPVLLRRASGRMEKVEVTLALRVEPTEFYLGHLGLSEFQAMVDDPLEDLAARYVPEPDLIRATWKRIYDPSTLAAKPTIEIELLG